MCIRDRFESYIPYFYATYEEENESIVSDKRKIVVLGSGPVSYTHLDVYKRQTVSK